MCVCMYIIDNIYLLYGEREYLTDVVYNLCVCIYYTYNGRWSVSLPLLSHRHGELNWWCFSTNVCYIFQALTTQGYSRTFLSQLLSPIFVYIYIYTSYRLMPFSLYLFFNQVLKSFSYKWMDISLWILRILII